MKFGVNTWVWTSPLTTAELEKLAPLVAGMGFDWIEVPLESLDDLDHTARRCHHPGTWFRRERLCSYGSRSRSDPFR